MTRVPAFPFQVRHADGRPCAGAPYAEMIEDVFTTHVRWELEHDLRHFMRRYMDIAEQRIGIWRIYFSAIGQIDEHSTELVSDVTSFRERLRAYSRR